MFGLGRWGRRRRSAVTVADVRSVRHHAGCTMPRYALERIGMDELRADFWGYLNYVWCMGTCDWPDGLRDARAVYEAAHGRGPWWWGRGRYLQWLREDKDREKRIVRKK